MIDDPGFSIQQAMAAQRALRQSLDLPEERFALPALIGMLSDEIELMRNAAEPAPKWPPS